MPKDEVIITDLLDGNIKIFSELDNYFKEVVCDNIRSHPNRLNILKSCFSKIQTEYPYHAFLMTFDLPEYALSCKSILTENPSILINNQLFYELLSCTHWIIDYVDNHLDQVVESNFDNIFCLLRYAFQYHKDTWLNHLINHPNLLIRIHTMYTMIDDFPHLFKKYYPNPISLLKVTHVDGRVDIVDESYLSKIAVLIILNLNDLTLYQEFKNFIFTNYPSNTLASIIDTYIIVEDEEILKKLLLADIDELFKTSKNYKWQLYHYYQKHLSPNLVADFKAQIRPFANLFPDEVIEGMSTRGLLAKFIELTYKYLELSTKAKCISSVGEGTCSYVYRVGDYIIKYSDKKYSFEDSICPNLYLIAKNYEEIINRDSYGHVTGALEVQKYLSKVVLPTETELLAKWQNALKEEGYYLVDDLVGQKVGSNCLRLDDYHDADTKDPENLPDWFKKDPVVLIDRDLIYTYKPSSHN